MLLSEEDVIRLMKKGFAKNSFTTVDKQGYRYLKNRQGYCVFYDLKQRMCSVYADRPMGCRVYPVIVDEEKGVVLDNLCPEIGSINDKEKSLKGKIVMKLLEEIDAEAANKRS